MLHCCTIFKIFLIYGEPVLAQAASFNADTCVREPFPAYVSLALLNFSPPYLNYLNRDDSWEFLWYTFIQFLNDQCEYGSGAGGIVYLWSWGSLPPHLLPLAYDLLQREEYGKRLQQQLLHRHHAHTTGPLLHIHHIVHTVINKIIKYSLDL